MTSFDDLGLLPPLAKAVREAGYTTPTAIQQQAIGPLLEGRDLLGLAQTGTGKTAAFALPILQKLHASVHAAPHRGFRPISALVLTPTRELAAQVGESFTTYGRHTGIRTLVIFGGVGIEPQKRALRAGTDILVATPGRLLDLAGQGVLDLKHLSVFVLDEADRMLDMGFIHDVKRVIRLLPPKESRQTMFFSATMPDEAQELADNLLRDPITVAVTPVSSTVERIEQYLFMVEKDDKRSLLAALLETPDLKKVLVFTRMKHQANRVAEHLEHARVVAAAIHGNKSQTARERALQGFRDGKVRVLVATDIAARGIDVDGVSHVINYDLPEVPETYVHRIGRTARAGRDGVALSFCSDDDRDYLRGIERLTKKELTIVEDHPWRSKQPFSRQPQRGGFAPSASGAGRGGNGNGGGGGRPQRGGRDGGHPARSGGGGGGGGAHAARGGDSAQRGGGAHAARGGDSAQRGGGAHASRGGDSAQRGGGPSQRGEATAQRGGQPQRSAGGGGGGAHAARSGNAAQRSSGSPQGWNESGEPMGPAPQRPNRPGNATAPAQTARAPRHIHEAPAMYEHRGEPGPRHGAHSAASQTPSSPRRRA